MIYDYNEEDNLVQIEKDFKNINILQDSLAFKRDKYRKFSQIIKIDFHVLEDCVKKYQKSLLISCYTYSEQIMKSLIYHLIEKGNHQNEYTNMFIDNKIPKNKFSPGVKINDIGKNIGGINGNFRYILNTDSRVFKIYDEMIISRHKYAHADNYGFEFEDFGNVLEVLKYITFEFNLLINDKRKRGNILKELNTIKSEVKKIKEVKVDLRSLANPRIKVARNLCKKFYGKYNTDLENVKLIKPLLIELENVSNINFRRQKKDEIYNKFEDLFKLL